MWFRFAPAQNRVRGWDTSHSPTRNTPTSETPGLHRRNHWQAVWPDSCFAKRGHFATQNTVNRTPLVTTWKPQLSNFSVLRKAAFLILNPNCKGLQEVLPLPIASYQRPANLQSRLVRTKPSAKAPTIRSLLRLGHTHASCQDARHACLSWERDIHPGDRSAECRQTAFYVQVDIFDLPNQLHGMWCDVSGGDRMSFAREDKRAPVLYLCFHSHRDSSFEFRKVSSTKQQPTTVQHLLLILCSTQSDYQRTSSALLHLKYHANS